MFAQIWGVAMIMLGLLVIADGYLQYVQQQTGPMRWLYIALGVILVVRGIFVWSPFSRRKS